MSYKIKSSLKIIGGIELPPAKARFDTKQGRERITASNHVEISGKAFGELLAAKKRKDTDEGINL